MAVLAGENVMANTVQRCMNAIFAVPRQRHSVIIPQRGSLPHWPIEGTEQVAPPVLSRIIITTTTTFSKSLDCNEETDHKFFMGGLLFTKLH